MDMVGPETQGRPHISALSQISKTAESYDNRLNTTAPCSTTELTDFKQAHLLAGKSKGKQSHSQENPENECDTQISGLSQIKKNGAFAQDWLNISRRVQQRTQINSGKRSLAFCGDSRLRAGSIYEKKSNKRRELDRTSIDDAWKRDAIDEYGHTLNGKRSEPDKETHAIEIIEPMVVG